MASSWAFSKNKFVFFPRGGTRVPTAWRRQCVSGPGGAVENHERADVDVSVYMRRLRVHPMPAAFIMGVWFCRCIGSSRSSSCNMRCHAACCQVPLKRMPTITQRIPPFIQPVIIAFVGPLRMMRLASIIQPFATLITPPMTTASRMVAMMSRIGGKRLRRISA